MWFWINSSRDKSCDVIWWMSVSILHRPEDSFFSDWSVWWGHLDNIAETQKRGVHIHQNCCLRWDKRVSIASLLDGLDGDFFPIWGKKSVTDGNAAVVLGMRLQPHQDLEGTQREVHRHEKKNSFAHSTSCIITSKKTALHMPLLLWATTAVTLLLRPCLQGWTDWSVWAILFLDGATRKIRTLNSDMWTLPRSITSCLQRSPIVWCKENLQRPKRVLSKLMNFHGTKM